MISIDRPHTALSAALSFLLLITLAPVLSAQAKKTADRAAEFDVFGGFTYYNTDFYPPYNDYGGTIGADYTKFLPRFRGLITPSFQVRGTISRGQFAGFRSGGAGLRIASSVWSLHPYIDFLAGWGYLSFDHPEPMPNGRFYRHDGTLVYTYGGGLTYDIKRSDFSILTDYQQQYWDLGGHPPNRFYPFTVTAGVVYHIPFKAYKVYR